MKRVEQFFVGVMLMHVGPTPLAPTDIYADMARSPPSCLNRGHWNSCAEMEFLRSENARIS